jgi:hypothetical protein
VQLGFPTANSQLKHALYPQAFIHMRIETTNERSSRWLPVPHREKAEKVPEQDTQIGCGREIETPGCFVNDNAFQSLGLMMPFAPNFSLWI